MVVVFLTSCQKANSSQPLMIKSIKNGIIIDKSIKIKSIAATNEKSAAQSSGVKNYVYKNGAKFNSRSDILIKFKQNINIKKFETKYNLKFKRNLTSGDILFENISGDTLVIINEILNENHDKIIRIMPNRLLNVLPI